MVGRKWVMLCVVCRSLQHCHSRVVAPGRAATTQQALAFTSSLLSQRGRQIGGKTPSTKNSVLLPPAGARQMKGKQSAVLATRIRAGRGMFSSSALEGRRRGGGGGGRGRGGGRRSPDYGPARAGQRRSNVPPGTSVEVVQKQHQRTGELTPGTVSRLLTNSGFHPRGIKVTRLM
ncbi:unnamed protein product [Ectocarpus sp. 8 AP-2014]